MGINHSSSCHAGLSCAVMPISSSSLAAGSYAGSVKDSCSVMEPRVAAKVLLLDGRVLRFTRKVRASQVLAGFRHHCLCPLDSASLASSDDTIITFFRPVSLHPDDVLRPPHLYILLPRRTFRLFAAAAAAATRNSAGNGRSRVLLHQTTAPSSSTRTSRVCDSGASISSKACATGACSATISKAGNIDQATDNSRIGTIKACHKIGDHDQGSTICDTSATTAADHRMPTSTMHHRTDSEQIKLQLPLQSYHIHTHGYIELMQPPSTTSQPLSCNGSTCTSSSLRFHPRRRSLDLHHASPSQLHRRPLSNMRRCRSWRPRLQAINEVHVYS